MRTFVPASYGVWAELSRPSVRIRSGTLSAGTVTLPRFHPPGSSEGSTESAVCCVAQLASTNKTSTAALRVIRPHGKTKYVLLTLHNDEPSSLPASEDFQKQNVLEKLKQLDS